MCQPSDAHQLLSHVSACIDDVASWMEANWFQLNGWMEQRPKTCGLRFIIDVTTPSTSVCNLSIFVDYDLTMQTHVSRTVSRCFAAQQHLQSVRHSVASDAFQWLIASTILTRLEYGNAMLSGNSAGLIICLQSVLDAAIRMIFRLRRRDHTSQAITISTGSERQKWSILNWLRQFAWNRTKLPVAWQSTPCQNLISPTPAIVVIFGIRHPPMPAVDDRSFAVAATKVWNGLPNHVISFHLFLFFTHALRLFYYADPTMSNDS